ncbi:phosphoglycolate phosphatase [Thermodesulfovibrio aggregans]|uniref:phosphoglycolate phosphatase n=1 Tax=Thermodesulfovibrio aggregans TaxID=86166 RepID=A0A0U9HWZ8_9BACT|nr:HAD-IA family hydrolase [Thermodesulfovibrio aggregans]GAQ94213.1 phosphoglycolate phosphatase [Thermodesulfovibrio aggregans]
MVELIIFDLDGTLVDSCEDIKQALNYCLEKIGISGFSTEEVKRMVGEGVNRLIEKALKARGVNLPSNELIDCFVNYYREHMTDFSKAYPEVKETLEQLKGFKKAVVSNKLTELSVKTLENLGLLNYIDFVAGSDFFSERKPSSVPIIETIKKFNTTQDKTIIVGDSELDIMAGRSAGVKTVAVTYGYRGKELLKDADFVIDKFSDLLKIVRKL